MQDTCEITLVILREVPSVIGTWHSAEVGDKKKNPKALPMCVFHKGGISVESKRDEECLEIVLC